MLLSAISTLLLNASREMWAMCPFSEVDGSRDRGALFTAVVMEHWHGLPMELVDIHLRKFQSLPRHGSEHPAVDDPALSRWLEETISRGPLQPQPPCGFVIMCTSWPWFTMTVSHCVYSWSLNTSAPGPALTLIVSTAFILKAASWVHLFILYLFYQADKNALVRFTDSMLSLYPARQMV